MAIFTVHYEEGGKYTARQTVDIEADTKAEAIEKAKTLEMRDLNYDYESNDCDYY